MALRVLGAALLHPDELGHALDEQFDEDFVARCLSEPGSYADDVSDRLTRAFALLASPEIDKPEPMAKEQVAWGGAESADGPMGWARRAAALRGGSKGVAALLNLVSPSSVPEDLARDGWAALLVEGSTHPWSRSFPKRGADRGGQRETRQQETADQAVLDSSRAGSSGCGCLPLLSSSPSDPLNAVFRHAGSVWRFFVPDDRPARDETSGDAERGGLAQHQSDDEKRMKSSRPDGTDEEQIGDQDSGSSDP